MDVNMPEMATGNGPVEVPEATKINAQNVDVFYGETQALHNVKRPALRSCAAKRAGP